jgi:phosphate starvation-inducible PhoH-like protein
MSPDMNEDGHALNFPDNDLAARLFGPHHGHLARIEQTLGVELHARGNQVTVLGPVEAAAQAAEALEALYIHLVEGRDVGMDEVDAMLRLIAVPSRGGEPARDPAKDAAITVKTRKRHISPRSPAQADYLRTIDDNDLVFGLGPAGTGKTYLAVAKAVERLIGGEVDRIILSRPAVEAGEQLGFLPGDMREKVDPYLRPLYDALYDMLPAEQVVKRLESGEIEVAPLAFMRGRTLAHAFVILDEAQNTTAVQMKMFLTRLGENARMVVTGDLSQVDLPRGIRSGLRDALETLNDVEGVGVTQFTEKDVVRHPLVSRIVRAYDARENARKVGARYEKDGTPDQGGGDG